MRTNFMREMDQLERNLELLANIGSTAPYVGLVGTVFGIMVTMHDMISSGDQAGIAAVALVFPKRCLPPQLVCLLRFRRCGLTTVLPLVWSVFLCVMKLLPRNSALSCNGRLVSTNNHIAHDAGA